MLIGDDPRAAEYARHAYWKGVMESGEEVTEFSVFSEKRNRYYVCKFDHDDARQRYAAGESVYALARVYNVSEAAVWRVVSPATAKRMAEATYRNGHTSCERCGKPCIKPGLFGKKQGPPLCQRCIFDDQRERLRFEGGVLIAVRCSSQDCANGERWQKPVNFTRGVRHREVRDGGIHGLCRKCQTRMKREWRRRKENAA